MTRLKNQAFLLIFFSFFVSSKYTFANLTCYSVKGIIIKFLKEHYSLKDFDNDFSKKVLEEYTNFLDPAKAIFLEKERADLIKLYSPTLRANILKGDCSPIQKVYEVYSRKLEKRYKEIKKFFRKNFDYSKDEYLDLGRRKKGYFKKEEDLEDYWRKRCKLELMRRQKYSKKKDDLEKAKQRIIKRYLRFYKQHVKRKDYYPFEAFLDSVGRVLDPHSNHLSKRELQDFEIGTNLSFKGIGAVLRGDSGLTSVVRIIAGGPADKNGKLKVKDQIIGVDKTKDEDDSFIDIVDLDLREVVSYIRGEKGTTVRLKVLRGGKEIIIPIVRDEIKLEDQAVKWTTFQVGPYQIGLIDLPSFYIDFRGRLIGKENYRSSTRDMKKALTELKKKKVDLVILDLRANGGGSLDAAVDITGLFTGKGPVVLVKKKGAEAVSRDYYEDPFYSKSLIVLVDRLSASASEILARAIKVYGRGIIVGETTHGKGTVQSLIPLGSEAIKVTVRKFYGPLGSSTQKKGVKPDIEFVSVSDIYGIGEAHYPGALEWSQIKPRKIKNFGEVEPYKAKLKAQSLARVNKSEKFEEIRKAIEKYKNDPNRDKISLKESKKSKEERKKREEEEKKLEKLASEESGKEFKPNLNEDPVLLETLRISGDYLLLQRKKKLKTLKIANYVPTKKEKKVEKRTD